MSGLAANTSYSYRLCGADQGESAVCANTESFVTGRSAVRARGDIFVPYGETGWRNIDFDVLGGPPSGRGRATVYNQEAGPPGGIALPLGSETEPNITCTVIAGNTAVVGFRSPPSLEQYSPYSSQHYAWLFDGGPADSGRDRFGASLYLKGEAPADCPAFATGSDLRALSRGDVAISGVSPTPAR